VVIDICLDILVKFSPDKNTGLIKEHAINIASNTM